MHVFPWMLSIVGVTAMLIVGRGVWWGWSIAFANECLWIAYALATQQRGFILGAVCYGAVNLTNAHRWLVAQEGAHNDDYSSHSG